VAVVLVDRPPERRRHALAARPALLGAPPKDLDDRRGASLPVRVG
jgi:hypothetical protein